MQDKKYDFKSVEEGKYDFWIKNNYFKSGDTTKEPFCIVVPPPNVTGNLHLGHAWNGTIQDIIIRYKKLNGFDTLWLPGMDHAAIATESKVVAKLKREGIDKYSFGRENFINECKKWSEEHRDNIRKQWAKLGCSFDYSKERFTLDEGLNNAVNYVFIDLYNKGLIYRKERIINWDPLAKTALSNEEVIYKEEKSKLYYLKYYLVDTKDYIEVATTRVETIFGDTAVAVNPNDKRYKDLIGKKVIVPLVNREVEVISDENVLIDFGTGALKITPAHALEDFEIGERHNLEIIKTINPDGTLNELTGKYNNMNILDARDSIIKDLEKENLITKMEDYTHSVGYSERTNALVEPFLSKQWFVKMASMSKNILEFQKTTDKINFIPKRFEKILNHWMSNCKDWCISRQLWWGHRIPAWYKGDEVYIGLNPPTDEWVQDNDVLDTWFSSALWPFSTLGWPNETEDLKRYFPTNVLVTAYDIIFFWVARMSFSSLEQLNKKPFDYCIIHGLIRDKNGKKMSKSLGNGIDPMDMIDKYGTDALRFYLSTSTSPGMDLKFDEEKVSSSWNFINKLWNASRFVLMNLEDFKKEDFTLDNLSIEDKWILTKLNKTILSVRKNMDKYILHTAGNEIYDFCWNVFCDWYIEFSKNNLESNTTKSVLTLVLDSILKMLHPFIPFVTEEMYLNLPTKGKSIMESDYPKYNKELIFNKEEKLVDKSITDITNIRNLKKQNNITKTDKIIFNSNEEVNHIFKHMLKLINSNEEEIKDLNKINYNSELIDINYYIKSNTEEEIKEKLLKEKELLESSINKRKTLLSNENYISKAPQNIVELDKQKLFEEEERLKIVLKSLN